MAKIVRTPEGAFFEETTQGRTPVSNPRTLQSLFEGGQQYEQVGQLSPDVPIPEYLSRRKLPQPIEANVPVTQPTLVQPTQPITPAGESPIERFNLSILDLLKKAQAGQTNLASETSATQRGILQEAQQPLTGELANLSPEQKLEVLRSREASYAPSIKAMDARVKQFEDIIDVVKKTYGDAGIASIIPSDETIKGYIDSYKQGMDISSIPSTIRNKVIGKLSEEDHNAHDQAKVAEAEGLGRLTTVVVDPNTGLPYRISKVGGAGTTPIPTTTPGVTTPTGTTPTTGLPAPTKPITVTPQSQLETVRNNVTNFTGYLDQADRQNRNRNLTNLVSKGDIQGTKDEINRIVESSVNKLKGTTGSANFTFLDTSLRDLSRLSDLINSMQARGKDTNIIKGAINMGILKNLGLDTDQDYIKLNSLSQTAMMNYIKSVSGAAFTDNERETYKGLFPSVFNQSGLNLSELNAMQARLFDDYEAMYKPVLQSSYDQLRGSDTIKVVAKKDGQFFTKNIKRSQAPSYLASGWLLTDQ